MRIFKTLLITGLALAFAGAAMAQTLGMAGTKRGFTNQASAAIAKVVSQKTPYSMRAQTFGGSSIYVPAVNAGQMEFGLANQLETLYAVTGTGIYPGRKHPNLRVVTSLIPFRSAIYVRTDSPIKTLADLRGKRVPSGWASQKIIGVLMNGYLANADLTYDDVVGVPAPSVVKAANDFAAGKTDMFFFAFGSAVVRETAAKVGGLRVLGMDPSADALARMRKHVPPAYPLLSKPSKANVGVDKPLYVMTYEYLCLANANVGEDIVYAVTKAMHDNKDDLAKSFGAFRLFSPQRMALDLGGLPYHPGAIKYYREVGAWPPKM